VSVCIYVGVVMGELLDPCSEDPRHNTLRASVLRALGGDCIARVTVRDFTMRFAQMRHRAVAAPKLPAAEVSHVCTGLN